MLPSGRPAQRRVCQDARPIVVGREDELGREVRGHLDVVVPGRSLHGAAERDQNRRAMHVALTACSDSQGADEGPAGECG